MRIKSNYMLSLVIQFKDNEIEYEEWGRNNKDGFDNRAGGTY
jgi:hypothetical protein